jgi:hypothetical protein
LPTYPPERGSNIRAIQNLLEHGEFSTMLTARVLLSNLFGVKSPVDL